MLGLTKKLKWTFAAGNGGRDTGFHDAGVDTFRGNFDRYLARELIQNSLDARADPSSKKPIEVSFELLTLKRSEIPDIESLQEHLQACAKFWSDDPKAKEFFKNATALAGKSTISVLRIGDLNTSGVLGKDNERNKMWYSLIRCAGASSKRGTEGGSFGIGKNAPFAASKLRTVFYSTHNSDGEHIFQGVAMLTSHELKSGAVLQPTGYLGGKGGESIRKKSDIPNAFTRAKQGTDVYILGFPAGATWDDDLTYSVLENFWPAIEWGDLVVRTGSQQINRNTLQALLTKFSTDENFTAHLYYSAYKSATHEFQDVLRKLGDVSVYLQTGDNSLPKRIAMIRKTGMVVFLKPFRSVTPFCGSFICKNDAGNKLLRDMEPPRHDVWDRDLPDKGDNRATEAEYVDFIRNCVRTLTKVDDSKVMSVPGLNRFLPDDDESDEQFGQEPDEKVDRKKLPEKIAGKKMETKGHATQKDVTPEPPDDEDTEIIDPPPRPPRPPRPSIPIRYRTFLADSDGAEYVVNIRPDDPKVNKVFVALWAVGDDQKYPLKIQSAKTSSGSVLSLSPDGYIGPVKGGVGGAPIKFVVKLADPGRIAMEVSAHEA